MPDPRPVPATLTLRATLGARFGLALGGAILAALFGAAAAGLAPAGSPRGLALWAGAALFGGVMVLGLRAARGGGALVRADAAGLLDTRLSAEPIPWEAIRAARAWRRGNRRALLLDLDDEAIPAPGPWQRLALGVHRLTGAGGVPVGVGGLAGGSLAELERVAAAWIALTQETRAT